MNQLQLRLEELRRRVGPQEELVRTLVLQKSGSDLELVWVTTDCRRQLPQAPVPRLLPTSNKTRCTRPYAEESVTPGNFQTLSSLRGIPLAGGFRCRQTRWG